MKTVIIAAVILIVIIISIVFGNFYIAKKIQSFNDLLTSITGAVESENWQESQQLVNQIEQDWSATSKRLALLFHHDELRNINIALANLKSYIGQSEKIEAMAQLSTLRFFTKYIKIKDKLYIENIF
ncbi:MAG: DUF4363 family protein [Clostridiaceae bacterium]|jgi:predicted PurR-regulated permease PerM|nr:DUF4363 family protein [Clostridiaceae bacterium]